MLCIGVNWKGTRLGIVKTGDFAMVHVGKVDDLDSDGDKYREMDRLRYVLERINRTSGRLDVQAEKKGIKDLTQKQK